MNWLKNRRNRLGMALAAGALFAVILTGMTRADPLPDTAKISVDISDSKGEEVPPIFAWWGTLYPKFCFSQIPVRDGEDGLKKDADFGEMPKLKISFWLAKAFDW